VGIDMKWADLTTREFDVLDRGIPVVLSTAAIEQHGPHLPVSTDTLIAEHFCAGMDQARTERVLVLPTVAVGYSRHHQEFGGTLSLSHQSFAAQVLDLAASVFQQGFTNLLLFNAHGGNVGIDTVLLERLGAAHPHCTVVFTSWWQVAGPELLELSDTGPGGVGHGCELETSLLLHAYPAQVRVELIPERVNQSEFSWDTGDLLRASRARVYRSMVQSTSTGVLGMPRAASAEKGAAISRLVLDQLLEILDSLDPQPGALSSKLSAPVS